MITSGKYVCILDFIFKKWELTLASEKTSVDFDTDIDDDEEQKSKQSLVKEQFSWEIESLEKVNLTPTPDA